MSTERERDWGAGEWGEVLIRCIGGGRESLVSCQDRTDSFRPLQWMLLNGNGASSVAALRDVLGVQSSLLPVA